MNRKKIALIYSCDESNWVSCKVITQNLRLTYEKAFLDSELKDFNYDIHTEGYDLYHLIKDVKDYAPDYIVFLDHKPHPKNFLIEYARQIKQKDRADFVFHLFGDFSLYCREWHDIESLLQECRVKFIAASHAQVGFVKQFLEISDRDKLISYMPFPVDEKQYYYDSKLREEARKTLEFENDEKVYLYTGRLSAQKNVNQMVKAFIEAKKISNSRSRLIIAGEFDNLGYPFFGNNYPAGYNYFNFLNVINEVPEEYSNLIEFKGNLSPKQLLVYYNACDVFVSLSQHNDEDYGMSPAEAICCGMPMILTGWGGYHSFNIPNSNVKLVEVGLKDSFYKVDFKQFIKLLLLEDESKNSDSKRESWAKAGSEFFSIQGNIERLQGIYNEEIINFSSWGKNFNKFQRCFSTSFHRPFAFRSPEFVNSERGVTGKLISKDIYRESYNEYIKPSDQ